MRIGLARRGFSPTGGAESYLRRLADALEAAGHEPVLLTTADWPRAQWPAHRGLMTLPKSGPVGFADRLAALKLAGICDRLFSLERVWQCDCYRAGDGVHRAWLARRAEAEPRWRRWFRSVHPKHRGLLALEKSLFTEGGARAIIANSQMVRDEIGRIYGPPPERIAVVYNGLPSAGFARPTPDARAQARAAYGLGEDEYVILFAGTGWERKGLAHALAAVDRLPDARRARLLVAGRGTPENYRRKMSPRGRERVRFLGPVADMRTLYAAADVFVAPTLYDPFANACLEALAAGLPVLTTRANGFAEIIEAGVDGDVFDTADRAEGTALADLLTGWADPARRAQAREVGAAKASGFTMEKNVAQTLEILLRGH